MSFYYLISFFIGFVSGIYVYSQMLLPLLYGLPKSVMLFFKKEVSIGAIFSQFIPPVIWLALLIILGYLSYSFIKPLYNFLMSSGFNAGNLIALVYLVLALLFSKNTRNDAQADYIMGTYIKYGINGEKIKELINNQSTK